MADFVSNKFKLDFFDIYIIDQFDEDGNYLSTELSVDSKYMAYQEFCTVYNYLSGFYKLNNLNDFTLAMMSELYNIIKTFSDINKFSMFIGRKDDMEGYA